MGHIPTWDTTHPTLSQAFVLPRREGTRVITHRARGCSSPARGQGILHWVPSFAGSHFRWEPFPPLTQPRLSKAGNLRCLQRSAPPFPAPPPPRPPRRAPAPGGTARSAPAPGKGERPAPLLPRGRGGGVGKGRPTPLLPPPGGCPHRSPPPAALPQRGGCKRRIRAFACTHLPLAGFHLHPRKSGPSGISPELTAVTASASEGPGLGSFRCAFPRATSTLTAINLNCSTMLTKLILKHVQMVLKEAWS